MTTAPAKLGKRAATIRGLEFEGWVLDRSAGTRKYDVYRATGDAKYFVGRSGALRRGRTVSDSISLTDYAEHKRLMAVGRGERAPGLADAAPAAALASTPPTPAPAPARTPPAKMTLLDFWNANRCSELFVVSTALPGGATFRANTDTEDEEDYVDLHVLLDSGLFAIADNGKSTAWGLTGTVKDSVWEWNGLGNARDLLGNYYRRIVLK